MYNVIVFFNDAATTEIYALSLHDALPICTESRPAPCRGPVARWPVLPEPRSAACRATWGRRRRPPRRTSRDRKSKRLNSSHANISYAVFCLKKKYNKQHSYAPEHSHPYLL